MDMEKHMAKKGLGKGLGALISADVSIEEENNQVIELKITEIEPNKNQPRKEFDQEKLAALSSSIKEYGVLQPVVVKKIDGAFYQLIAGERRWRAARMAKLKTIPAVIREFDDKQSMEIALIENLQRENLNPIEEAMGYQELIDLFHLTQEELAAKMGKSRSAIANALRLLNLPDGIKKMVMDNQLSMGHARALLSLEAEQEQLHIAEQIIKDELSVRQTEKLIQKMQKLEPVVDMNPEPLQDEIMRYIEQAEKEASNRLGTRVKILHKKGKGKIEIEYYSNDDLERLLNIIK